MPMELEESNILCECCGHKKKVHSEYEWPPPPFPTEFPTNPAAIIRPPGQPMEKRWRCHFLTNRGYHRHDSQCPCDFFVPMAHEADCLISEPSLDEDEDEPGYKIVPESRSAALRRMRRQREAVKICARRVKAKAKLKPKTKKRRLSKRS